MAAEGEHRASRALRCLTSLHNQDTWPRPARHAAEVISANPVALQLRYLQVRGLAHLATIPPQTLEGIAAEHNSTIVFPVPVDVLAAMLGPLRAPPTTSPTMPTTLPTLTPLHPSLAREDSGVGEGEAVTTL